MIGRGPRRPEPGYEELAARHAETEAALAQARTTLEAVRAGGLDALGSGSDHAAELLELGYGDRFFRALVAAMQEGAASLDAGGTVLYANPRLAELIGLPLEQVVGRGLAELATDVSAPRVERLLARAARAPVRAALELVAGDGRHVPVAVSAARLAGEDGELCLLVTDLSEQRRAEAELGASEQRFRLMVDGVQDYAIVMLEVEGHVATWNAGAQRLKGYRPEEIIGRHFSAFYPPEDLAVGKPVRLLAAAAVEGRVEDEGWRVRKDGTRFWANVVITALRDADGSLRGYGKVTRDLSASRLYEERLEYLAGSDPVTGLPNRRSFEQALAEHAERVARYGPEGALLVLDLDHFKYVNDTLGHGVGDEVLLLAAGALRERLRETDTLARLGGDEFAVLLPRADRAATELVAGELLGALRAVETPGTRPVTASAGIALFSASETDPEEILVRADVAMYEAKEAGRDRSAFYAEGEAAPKTRIAMGRLVRLEEALAAGALALYAQPLVDFGSGQVDRYELLVRLRGEGAHVLPATEFIPLAERFGLIAQIDRAVFERAVGLLSNGGGTPDLRLAVNVSAKSLADEGYVDFVAERLAAAPAAASRLTFELTETAAVANLGTARRFAERLQALGSDLALDDFGAGFGAFSYLRHIPFDLLKIDGQFVTGCVADPRDRAIVESVVQVAHSLGKRTVAEFVGDERTVEVLREIGVDLGQGYHVGRPAPVEDGLAPGGSPR